MKKISTNDAAMCVVYRAVNSINGKRYIGMTTKGLAARRSGHLSDARCGSNTRFSRAIRKYGGDNFCFSIVEVCPNRENAFHLERDIIAREAPEYNIAAGGQGGPQGWKHSEESRREMSKSRRGRKGYWGGKKRTAETLAKMSASMIAARRKPPVTVWTPEKIERCRERLLRQSLARRRRVICLSDGKKFDEAKDAAAVYGFSATTIRKACLGIRQPANGLVFQYESQI